MQPRVTYELDPGDDTVRLFLNPDDASSRRRPVFVGIADGDVELFPELDRLLENDPDTAPADVERPPLEDEIAADFVHRDARRHVTPRPTSAHRVNAESARNPLGGCEAAPVLHVESSIAARAGREEEDDTRNAYPIDVRRAVVNRDPPISVRRRDTPPMTYTAQQLKKTLVDAGLEVFRARGDEVVLAERPRENLIMDSGVRLRASTPLEVRVVLRAQKAEFPNEDEEHIFARVRALAAAVTADGFVEIETSVSPVIDPGDASHTLDTFYEIYYSKPAADLEAAVASVRAALAFEKRA